MNIVCLCPHINKQNYTDIVPPLAASAPSLNHPVLRVGPMFPSIHSRGAFIQQHGTYLATQNLETYLKHI